MIAPPHPTLLARAPAGLRTLARALIAALLLAIGAPGTAGAQSQGSANAGAPTLSPAREYRAALAEGDATRAAGAVLRMWRGRLTENGLRDLNRRLRVEADERTVAAVVLEVSRLQNSQQGEQTQPAPTEAPGERVVRWLSEAFRPAVPAPGPAQTGSVNPTAPVTGTGGPAVRESIQPPKPAAPARTQAPKREPTSNPAVEYEQALLTRDVRRMARAAAQVTGAPVTAESLRKLNDSIGLPPDDELVQAVVAAARATRRP